MGIVLTLLENTLAISYSYLLFGSFLKKKKRWGMFKVSLLLFVIGSFYYVSGEFIIGNFGIGHSLGTTVLLLRYILCSLLIILPFAGTLIQRMFLSLLSVLLGTAGEVTAILLYWQNSRLESIHSLPDGDRSMISLFGNILTFLLVFIIKWFRRNRKAIAKAPALYVLEMLIPIASMAAITFSFLNMSRLELVVVSAFMAFVNLVAYFLFDKLEQYYAENQTYALQEQHHRLREEYYQQLEMHQKEIRTIKHDLQNQLVAISASYPANQVGEKNQLGEIIEHLSQATEYDFTAHPGVNAVLRIKYKQAQAEGIACEWEVILPEDIRMDTNDLAAMLGNVLDNAIEACRYCVDTKYIRLQLIHWADSLVLSWKTAQTNIGMTL